MTVKETAQAPLKLYFVTFAERVGSVNLWKTPRLGVFFPAEVQAKNILRRTRGPRPSEATWFFFRAARLTGACRRTWELGTRRNCGSSDIIGRKEARGIGATSPPAWRFNSSGRSG